MAELTAKSGSITDVQAAVRSAKAGDTVIIPKGTHSWNAQLAINGGTFSDGSPRGKSVNLFGDDVTIINNFKTSSTWADQDLIRVQTSPESTVEVKGINFEEGPALTGGGSIGHTFMRVSYIAGWGQGNQAANRGRVALIHDCNFLGRGNTSMCIRQMHRGGLVYNCSFTARARGNEVGFHYQGEGTWGQPSTWGVLDNTGLLNNYIEDCTFNDFGTGYAFDSSAGARLVIRHCKFNKSLIGSHGLESDPMGMRHAEVYNNTFSGSGPYCWIHMRGGSWVVFGNDFGAGPGAVIFMTITALNRRAVAFAPPCPTKYPIPRQIGQGWANAPGGHGYEGYPQFASGNNNITEPVCIWNNTSKVPSLINFTDDPDTCGNRLFTRDFIREGRDYLLSAKAGYTPYPYPHPLRPRPEPPPSTSTYDKWIASLLSWVKSNPPVPD